MDSRDIVLQMTKIYFDGDERFKVEKERLQNKEMVRKGLCYQNLHFILLMLPLTHFELYFSQFCKKCS